MIKLKAFILNNYCYKAKPENFKAFYNASTLFF